MRSVSLLLLTVAVVLLLVGGFFGTALIFGNPSYRQFLEVAVPVGLGLGFALAIIGGLLLRRCRIREKQGL